MTPASSTSTVIAEISVSDLNAMSPRRKRRSVAARPSSAWTEAISLPTTAASIISKTLHSVAVATCRKDEDRNGQRPPYPLAYPSLVHGEDRLAGRVLDVAGPHLLNVVDDLVRHRDVVELLGHLVAVLVRPGEEFERFGGRCRIFRLLVQKAPRTSRHRPWLIARLVGENDSEAGLRAPLGARSRSLEGLGGRGYSLARLVHHVGVDHLVLLGIGVFDIANRAFGVGHIV